MLANPRIPQSRDQAAVGLVPSLPHGVLHDKRAPNHSVIRPQFEVPAVDANLNERQISFRSSNMPHTETRNA